MMGERNIVGRCLFCPLGKESERGVARISKEGKPILGHSSYENRRPIEIITYECALGEIGKECVIPRIYALAVEGTRVGSYADMMTRPIG